VRGRRPRAAILAVLVALAMPARADEPPVLPAYPAVRPGVPLRFPADHGAHPAFRTEWWYLTGWLRGPGGQERGFQVTFFRTRPAIDQRETGAFAPDQILLGHAALADPAQGRLLHDQRARRVGFGLAEAATGETDIVLGSWRLTRDPTGRFHARVPATGFSLDLDLDPTQAVLLQGDRGYSRKGSDPAEASYYFSLPHLAVTGTVVEQGRSEAVTGEAWLDREWTSTLLDPAAVGWDWLGANLDDGSALTAFQIRDAAGRAIWAGGSWRGADGVLVPLGPADIAFATERRWLSPRTGTSYPVEQSVAVTIDGTKRLWHLAPLFDDQELDSRPAGGPVYWEGAVRLEGGRGYLELTGYLAPLKL